MRTFVFEGLHHGRRYGCRYSFLSSFIDVVYMIDF